MSNSILLLGLFVTVSLATTNPKCVWKDGSTAIGYVACKAGATEGNCCSEGEACLDSGFCWGAHGLVYRGACVNNWDPNTCTTDCEDISSNWANIVPCTDGKGSVFASYYWCGTPAATTCSKTNGTVLKITPGKAVRILPMANQPNILVASSSSTSAPSATSPTSSSTSVIETSYSTTAASSCPKTSSEGAQKNVLATCADTDVKVVAVGAGLGIPLAITIIALLILLWMEMKRRKAATELKTYEASYPAAKNSGSIVSYQTEQHSPESRHYSYFKPSMPPTPAYQQSAGQSPNLVTQYPQHAEYNEMGHSQSYHELPDSRARNGG